MILYILIYLITIIHAQEGCLAVSSCLNGDRCSSNGRCYYNFQNQIFNYKKNNSLSDSNVTKIYYYEHCICNKGWESLDSEQIKCCYNQKKQLNAFLLEFFVGFGCGHFYINRNNTAIIKLICCVSFCFYCYCIAICLRSNEQGKEASLLKKIIYIGTMINFIAYILWWFIDVIFFGFNLYVDGNNMKLNPW